MKKILCALAIFGLTSAGLADDARWLTSLPAALAQAQQEGKTVLIDFTGSDWCGWCKKLDAETLSQPVFLDYARKNLVLVRIDFPRSVPQSAEERAANKDLKDKFEVGGFPTLISAKSDGSVIWKQTGYLPGGPAALIGKLGGTPQAPPAPAPAPAAHPVNLATGYPAPPPRTPGDGPKLQGIFFSSHPTAMIDGHTCEEGDAVSGARVLKITRKTVIVNWNGQTNELTMK